MLEVFALHDGKWVVLAVHADDEKLRAKPFEAAELDLASRGIALGPWRVPTPACSRREPGRRRAYDVAGSARMPTVGRSLREELFDDDARVRLDAVDRAAREGDAADVARLLHVALHADVDVKVGAGPSEPHRNLADAAAGALRLVFDRIGVDSEAVRAAALDLRQDDARVGALLYFLGPHADALRAELLAHDDERLRLRAERAVLSTERTGDDVRRALLDPSPLVRQEALSATRAWSEYPRVLIEDPSPDVRRRTAVELRAGTRHADAILRALQVEREDAVRAALVACLPGRMRDVEHAGAIRDALIAALDEPTADARRVAAEALRDVDDARVGRAIAERIPRETHRLALYALVGHRYLPRDAPRLYDFVADLWSTTTDAQLRSAAVHTLVAYGRGPVERAVEMLLGDDPLARTSARFLLVQVGGTAALAALHASGTSARERKLTARVAAQLREKLAADGVAIAKTDALAVDDGRAGRGGVPTEREAVEREDAHAPDCYAHALVLGVRRVPLALDVPVALTDDDAPTAVVLALHCDACNAAGSVPLPLRFHSMDDDRFAARETTYVGAAHASCPACAAAWYVEVFVDVEERRLDGARALTWNGRVDARGARVRAFP